MDERSQRLCGTMAECLGEFQKGKIGLGSLISALDSLIVLLGDEGSRDERFRYEWGTLEMVYAIALDREMVQLPVEHQQLIDNAIQNLRRLVEIAVAIDGTNES